MLENPGHTLHPDPRWALDHKGSPFARLRIPHVYIAVVIYTPTFIIPSTLIAAAGGYLGNIYLRAQLSVKREMSNAKAPVIGILGGAISGLRK